MSRRPTYAYLYFICSDKNSILCQVRSYHSGLPSSNSWIIFHTIQSLAVLIDATHLIIFAMALKGPVIENKHEMKTTYV